MWNHVLLLTAATVANARSEAAVVGVTLTSTDQSHLFEAQTPLSLGPAAANPNIRVEGGTAYQRVVGYGAAITDASAWVLHSAPPLLYDAMMKLLFSPLGSTGSKGGVGLSIVRVPIGVSDFSISYAPGNITYADTPGDWDLEHFSTAHDDAYILPVLRRARQLNPRLKIVASPWTAPLWLKTEGGTLGRGTLLPSERVYETYARYFVKFVLDYLRKGVVVDYITLQNEPGHAGCGTMPCMLLAEPDEARLAVLVGQQLAAAGLGKQTRILGYDHNWGAQPGVAISGPKYPMALFANATVAAYIAGTAWHCYGGSESAQTPVHAAHPTKETHMTECSGGGWSGPWASNFVSNIRRLFIGNSNAWGQSALLWNMALDEHAGPRCQGGACCTDCRGVLTVPSNSSSLADIERNVEFYSLAHFSAFVPQGSVRVKSQRVSVYHHAPPPSPPPLPQKQVG
jgi:glucosylceramidase